MENLNNALLARTGIKAMLATRDCKLMVMPRKNESGEFRLHSRMVPINCAVCLMYNWSNIYVKLKHQFWLLTNSPMKESQESL